MRLPAHVFQNYASKPEVVHVSKYKRWCWSMPWVDEFYRELPLIVSYVF